MHRSIQWSALHPIEHGIHGAELWMARHLFDHGTTNIAIVKVACGGTSLYKDWNSESGGPYWYALTQGVARAVAAFPTEHTLEPLAFFWQQGGNDAKKQVMATSYSNNLVNLAHNFCNFMEGQGMSVSNMQFITALTVTGGVKRPYLGTVRLAQESVPAQFHLGSSVETADLPLFDTNGHINAIGQNRLGIRLAEKMMNTMKDL
ncbi:MAG: sialate O-acetylesterase [Verrucomicrobiota bacterium]